MDNIAIFFIILLITLSLGAIACGIYVAVQRNKPEYKRDPARAPSVIPIVSFIMVLSLVVGLLIFTIYYAIYKVTPIPPNYIDKFSCPKPKTFLTPEEFDAVEKAEETINQFANKVGMLPMGMRTDVACPNGVCVNPFTKQTMTAFSGSPQNIELQKKATRTMNEARANLSEAIKKRDELFGEVKVGGSATTKNPWKK